MSNSRRSFLKIMPVAAAAGIATAESNILAEPTPKDLAALDQTMLAERIRGTQSGVSLYAFLDGTGVFSVQ